MIDTSTLGLSPYTATATISPPLLTPCIKVSRATSTPAHSKPTSKPSPPNAFSTLASNEFVFRIPYSALSHILSLYLI